MGSCSGRQWLDFQLALTVPKRLHVDTHLVEQTQMQTGELAVFRILDVAPTLQSCSAAKKEDGQVIGVVLVALRHPGTVKNHRVIEK